MYKKFASIFLMVSLSLFIFNLSHAATFTFEEGKYQVYCKYYIDDYDSYIADLNNLENLTPNFISSELPSLEVPDEILKSYPYFIFCCKTKVNNTTGNTFDYYFVFTDRPAFTECYGATETGYSLNGGWRIQFDSNFTNVVQAYIKAGQTEWTWTDARVFSNSALLAGSGSYPICFYYTNYDVYNIVNNSISTYASTNDIFSSDVPSMQNPLTNEEIKSILQIFLDSVRNADLPDHYGRYVLTYNQETGQYRGFVYPSYINLGLQYINYNEDGTVTVPLNSTGDYYRLIVHNEEENYLFMFFDAIEMMFKNPLFYEFTSNSTNTLFNFNTTYPITGDIPFSISTINEPIIYTSHKIYSLFLVDESGFGTYEVDEETSVEKQEFINSETGLPEDTTINEYTEEISSDVNVLSFIKLLFEFIYALVSFLARFFTFIITFIMVPASTKILPQEFVTGIDWIHSFAFGDIFLWEIFSILFGVLLSLYIVKLIRSH